MESFPRFIIKEKYKNHVTGEDIWCDAMFVGKAVSDVRTPVQSRVCSKRSGMMHTKL